MNGGKYFYYIAEFQTLNISNRQNDKTDTKGKINRYKMSEFQYILEPYNGQKTRYTCPNCLRKKQFTRYIDIETKEYLSENVGKCNRDNKCGYHYTPKQYFQDNNQLTPPKRTYLKPQKTIFKQVSYLDYSLVQQSMRKYQQNNFIKFLQSKFGNEITQRAINNYKIGTSKLWKGATVFWQIDKSYRVRTGKIMLYNGSKRVKHCNNWVHSIMKINDFNLSQCFFGEHLINGNNSPIAVVESEKTAIIGSIYFPQYIWLATAGSGGINSKKLKALENRTIILFPDASINGKMYQKWVEKTKSFKNVFINQLLELNTTEEEKEQGVDLADFLLKYSLNEFRNKEIKQVKSKKMITLDKMIKNNPNINNLINGLSLNII